MLILYINGLKKQLAIKGEENSKLPPIYPPTLVLTCHNKDTLGQNAWQSQSVIWGSIWTYHKDVGIVQANSGMYSENFQTKWPGNNATFIKAICPRSYGLLLSTVVTQVSN